MKPTTVSESWTLRSSSRLSSPSSTSLPVVSLIQVRTSSHVRHGPY